jgi:ankyrin repeat protein
MTLWSWSHFIVTFQPLLLQLITYHHPLTITHPLTPTMASMKPDIVQAAADGNVEWIRRLLAAQADINTADVEGSRALHVAARNSHYEATKLLIEAKADLEARRKIGSTPLMMCSDGAVQQLLLDAKADVQATRVDGRTALTFAAEYNYIECARVLLNAKADINARFTGADDTVKRYTPLYPASEFGNSEILGMLVEAQANVNEPFDGIAPLYAAARGGYAQSVQILLSAKADVDRRTVADKTALMVAACNHHVECVKLLLDAKANPNVVDTVEPLLGMQNATPLLLALSSQTDEHEIAKLLLDANADPNITNKGIGPLLSASFCGFPKSVQLLLDAKALIDQQMDNGFTPLYAACEDGHLDVMRILLAAKANLSIECKWGRPPLIGACENNHPDLIDDLLAAGANVNRFYSNNETPLITACKNGTAALVAKLLSHKAETDPLFPDKPGVEYYTPLYEAARSNKDALAMVQLLLHDGALVDRKSNTGKTPLHAACHAKHLDVVRALVDAKASLEARDSAPPYLSVLGATPLLVAVEATAIDIVQYLLDRAADPNVLSQPVNVSPLISAAFQGSVPLVRTLVAAKADLNQKMAHGYTPLYAAAEEGHTDCIRELLLARADLNAVTDANNTALYSALQHSRIDAATVLLQYGISEVNALPVPAQHRALLTPEKLAMYRASLEWSFDNHYYSSAPFRHAIKSLMLVYWFGSDSVLLLLPRELLWLLFAHLRHVWTDPAAPEPLSDPDPPSLASSTSEISLTGSLSSSGSGRKKKKCLIS